MARKKHIEIHPCSECAEAHLVKYTYDPLIAECKRTGEKNVASTHISCPLFKPLRATPQIEHRKKRIGITDIYL